VRGETLARYALDIPRHARPRVAISDDGRHAGICATIDRKLVLRIADRSYNLPGNTCRAFAPDLSRVVVERGVGELEAVHLATGRTTQIAGIDASFVGPDALVVRDAKRVSRRDLAREPNTISYVRLAGAAATATTMLGAVPFGVDEINPGADGRSVVLLREKSQQEPARAWVFVLPDGPGGELPIPTNTLDLSLVP
jgi:hypothetical protein